MSPVREYDLLNTVRSVQSINPDEYAATVNGVGVDSQGAYAILWLLDVGDVEGAPTDLDLDVKIQDSDDNVAFADAKDEANANIAFAQVDETGSAQIQELMDKLHANAKAGNRPSKRYRRAVGTILFTGGTTPNVAFGCHALVVSRYLKSVAP